MLYYFSHLLKELTYAINTYYAKHQFTYKSPCLHHHHLPQVYRRICLWQLWSSRCSPVLGWFAGVGGGKECHRSESPQPRLSAGFPTSWISSDLMKAPHLWLGNLSDLKGGKKVIRISIENSMLDYAYPSWKSLGTNLTLFTSSLNNL